MDSTEVINWISELDEEILNCVDDVKLLKLVQKRNYLIQSLNASKSIMNTVIRSHKSVCKAKNMDEKAAYGNDPAVYYSLAICGEAGEMANKIVKALRNGTDVTAVKNAVISELPDIFIYSGVLGYVLDLDVAKLVEEKVDIVVNRATSGYYGPPFK